MKQFKIVTMHYAGGNAYSYRFLEEYLNLYEVINLELPGRGRRIKEDLIRDPLHAVEDLFIQVKSKIHDDDYIIYGHSMGALLAFAVAAKMSNIGRPPKKIVVSGNAGPGIHENKSIYKYSNHDFQEEIVKLGGMHEDVLNSPEIMSFFLPIIKSDFQVAEEFDVAEFGQLKIPIHVIMGSEEEYVDHIENWKNFTQAELKKDVLVGNHFFIHEHPEILAKIISQ